MHFIDRISLDGQQSDIRSVVAFDRAPEQAAYRVDEPCLPLVTGSTLSLAQAGILVSSVTER